MAKEKENKKLISLRLEVDLNKKYDEYLEKVFGENHRKKGTILETLIEQVIKQDPEKLREYYENEKDMINLSDETIEKYEKESKEKDKLIENLKKQIEDGKRKYEQHIEERKTDATNNTKQYETRLEEKNETIKEKDKIIDQQVQANEKLQNTIDKMQENMDKMQESMDILNTTIDTSNKDVKTARNDYKHIVELLNKTQAEYNEIQNENKKLNIMFVEIKKMSLIDRILRNYPDNIKEITSSENDK